MKILLVNPISGDYQVSYMHKRILPPVPPTGLCYIAAVLEKADFEVDIIDQYAYGLNNQALLSRIEELNPDVIGFSCLTPTINNIQLLSSRIKQRHGNKKIVLGNLHATLFSEQILKDGIADFIVRNEGEHTCLELFLALRSGGRLSEVRGISYVCEDKIRHNSDRDSIICIDTLPYPAWHLLDLNCYCQAPMLTLQEPTLLIQASRGCPFRCVFCAQDKVHKGFRKREIKKVVDEIQHMHHRFGVRSFVFGDSFFPWDKQSGYLFCEEMITRRLHEKIKWTTEMRSDQLDGNLLNTMKKSGLHLIMFGFETGNQHVLNMIKKKATLKQAKDTMALVKKSRIKTLGLFMLGLPGESVDTCRETISFAKELDCDMVKFNICIPYPGTELFEKNRDKIDQSNFEDFTSWGAWLSNGRKLPFVPRSVKSEELIKLQQFGMFSYYVRPHIIFRHLKSGSLSLSNVIFGGFFLFYRFLKALIENITGFLRGKKDD